MVWWLLHDGFLGCAASAAINVGKPIIKQVLVTPRFHFLMVFQLEEARGTIILFRCVLESPWFRIDNTDQEILHSTIHRYIKVCMLVC